jgi:mannose-6-phosphate isomerase-like protein (cupin superfamily)
MTRRVDKPWGFEEIWAETDHYVGKVLVLNRGSRLSLQAHRVKEETLYVESGRICCLVGASEDSMAESILGPGETVHISPGMLHRFEALEDTRIFEVSTPHLDDVERLSDDFGREGTSKP